MTIHFDNIGAEMSQPDPESELSIKIKQSTLVYVNAIQNDADSDEFSIKIKNEYKDLFNGIGNMNTVIDI